MNQFGISQPERRERHVPLLTDGGAHIRDTDLLGGGHFPTLRSPRAQFRIVPIDQGAAREMPSVLHE